VPKSIYTVHKQGRIKVMVNIQSLIHPYIFSKKSKDVGIGLCIFTITFILPCLCTVYFLACHSYISFGLFLLIESVATPPWYLLICRVSLDPHWLLKVCIMLGFVLILLQQ